MDLTPVEAMADIESLDGQDPQAHAEGVLKRRIAALIDKVSSVVFSYIAQVLLPALPSQLSVPCVPSSCSQPCSQLSNVCLCVFAADAALNPEGL